MQLFYHCNADYNLFLLPDQQLARYCLWLAVFVMALTTLRETFADVITKHSK